MLISFVLMVTMLGSEPKPSEMALLTGKVFEQTNWGIPQPPTIRALSLEVRVYDDQGEKLITKTISTDKGYQLSVPPGKYVIRIYDGKTIANGFWTGNGIQAKLLSEKGIAFEAKAGDQLQRDFFTTINLP